MEPENSREHSSQPGSIHSFPGQRELALPLHTAFVPMGSPSRFATQLKIPRRVLCDLLGQGLQRALNLARVNYKQPMHVTLARGGVAVEACEATLCTITMHGQGYLLGLPKQVRAALLGTWFVGACLRPFELRNERAQAWKGLIDGEHECEPLLGLLLAHSLVLYFEDDEATADALAGSRIKYPTALSEALGQGRQPRLLDAAPMTSCLSVLQAACASGRGSSTIKEAKYKDLTDCIAHSAAFTTQHTPNPWAAASASSPASETTLLPHELLQHQLGRPEPVLIANTEPNTSAHMHLPQDSLCNKRAHSALLSAIHAASTAEAGDTEQPPARRLCISSMTLAANAPACGIKSEPHVEPPTGPSMLLLPGQAAVPCSDDIKPPSMHVIGVPGTCSSMGWLGSSANTAAVNNAPNGALMQAQQLQQATMDARLCTSSTDSINPATALRMPNMPLLDPLRRDQSAPAEQMLNSSMKLVGAQVAGQLQRQQDKARGFQQRRMAPVKTEPTPVAVEGRLVSDKRTKGKVQAQESRTHLVNAHKMLQEQLAAQEDKAATAAQHLVMKQAANQAAVHHQQQRPWITKQLTAELTLQQAVAAQREQIEAQVQDVVQKRAILKQKAMQEQIQLAVQQQQEVAKLQACHLAKQEAQRQAHQQAERQLALAQVEVQHAVARKQIQQLQALQMQQQQEQKLQQEQKQQQKQLEQLTRTEVPQHMFVQHAMLASGQHCILLQPGALSVPAPAPVQIAVPPPQQFVLVNTPQSGNIVSSSLGHQQVLNVPPADCTMVNQTDPSPTAQARPASGPARLDLPLQCSPDVLLVKRSGSEDIPSAAGCGNGVPAQVCNPALAPMQQQVSKSAQTVMLAMQPPTFTNGTAVGSGYVQQMHGVENSTLVSMGTLTPTPAPEGNMPLAMAQPQQMVFVIDGSSASARSMTQMLGVLASQQQPQQLVILNNLIQSRAANSSW